MVYKPENTASQNDVSDVRQPKYKKGILFTQHDLYIEDTADLVIDLLKQRKISHTEWNQVSEYINIAIGRLPI